MQVTRQLDFKISTGLKNIIGKELITEAHTAIFELVKNSYDADATKVTIVFKNIVNSDKENKPTLYIIDDGNGMSYDDINEKWLFVGYSEKKPEKTSESDEEDYRDKVSEGNRIFAGAKGIGRFSADRLGPILNLYTKKKEEDTIHQLKIDWNKFEEDQNQRFQTIKVDYTTANEIPLLHPDLKNFKQGTILEIFPLNDKWDRAKLVRLKQYLQRLVNPTQIYGNEEFKIEIIAEEFLDDDRKYRHQEEQEHQVVNGIITNIVFEKLKIKTTQINCFVKEDKITTEIIDKGSFIFRVEEENSYKPLSNINIHVFYLNKEAKSTFTKTMGLRPFEFGSIFLYKNGFRIHPLGDPKDDWLDLEARKGQGYGRNLSRREIIGRVEVNHPQSGFREVSSRDRGVVRTQEYDLLVELLQRKILRWLARYVVEGIDWDRPEEKRLSDEEIKERSINLIAKLIGQVKDPQKNIKFNPELLSIFKKKEIEHLPEVIKNVEGLLDYVKDSPEKKFLQRQVTSLRNISKNLTAGMKAQEQQLEIKEREILFLQKTISPDREIVEDYHHTIRIATGYIESYLIEINKKIAKGSKINEILPLLDQINLENQKVQSLVGLVSKAHFNLKTKDIRRDVVEFIKQYLETILRPAFKRIRYNFQNDHLTLVTRFKPLEISTIIDNFVSNSRKAGATLIKVRFEIKNNKLHVLIGDNGKGIGKHIEKHLFTRGFTTTDGSGIGLSHIKSIVEKMGGRVRFVENNFENLGSGACFEMILV